MVLWSLVILVAYTSVASFLSSFSAEPATSIVPGTNNKRSLLEVLPEAGADPHEIILSSPKYKMPSKSSRRKKFSVIGTVFKTVYNNAVVPFLDVTDLELDAPSPAPPLTVKDEDVRPQNPFDTSLGGDDDDGEDECSSIGTRTGSKCQFVKDHCGDVATLFNYLEFHYCTMDSAPVVSLILLAFAVLYWISLLTSTADDYFVVQLHVLSEKLALSDEVAGKLASPCLSLVYAFDTPPLCSGQSHILYQSSLQSTTYQVINNPCHVTNSSYDMFECNL